jgi:surface polysaccharide O-acyltransferase-like enzyme
MTVMPAARIPPPAEAASPAAESRSLEAHQHNWDRLRVVGCLDIIGSHLTGTHLFAGVGLPVFFIISIALSVRRPSAGDGAAFMRKRLLRVLIPWIFWSAVIGLVFAARAAARGELPLHWVQPRMVFYGPEIHLWFLPFNVASAAAVYGVHQLTADRPARRVAWSAWALSLAALALCPSLELGWPFEQWGFSVPAIGLGFAVGRLLSADRAHAATRLEITVLAAAFALAAALLYRRLPGTAPYVIRHAGGMLLVAAALWLPNPADRVTQRIAPLTFGVYILHLLVYREIADPLSRATGLTLGGQRIALDFALSLAVVALLRATPLRRVL